jgi:phosphatidylserine/phosphatidylglycerophosphate/cardiolipin synthase-like enzyme
MKYYSSTRFFVFLLLCLLVLTTMLFGQGTITAVKIPTSVASGGGVGTVGYPYAAFVQIQGWTACASSQALLKIYSGTNNEYMWSATNVWSNSTPFSNTNQPVADVDASGNWSGWIYMKHNDNVGASASIRVVKVGATATRLTTALPAFTILNMVTGAGWIFRSTSPAENKGILAYSGGNIVGMYRSENNGIDEGYTYGSGGFKIAVPIGIIDSLVALNDDGTRFQSFAGPWAIAAGQETDASTGGGTAGKGTATIEPSAMQGGVTQSLTVKLFGEAPDTITSARIRIPSLWSWTESASDVNIVGGGSPSVNVSGDTVKITNMSLIGNDSMSIQFSNLTPYDTTAYFSFITETAILQDTVAQIATNPRVFIYGTPLPISIVKQNDVNGVPLRNNTYVTVRGIVNVANQFGGPSYIQDNSGGFAIFGSTFSTNVNIGDEVIVSGLVQPFNGLSEIVSPMLHTILSASNTIDPLVVTTSQVAGDGVGGVEQYEGMLVRLNNVTVTDTFGTAISAWTVSGSGTNYRLNDVTGHVDVRVDKDVNFANVPAPQSQFDIIGVVSQFKSTSPYIGGYQLMPRFSQDILSAGPIIASVPVETEIQPSSVTISWTTLHPGTSRLKYGTTRAYEIGFLSPDDSLRTSHVITLTGLSTATIYNVQAFSVSGSDTSYAANLVISTSSAPPTTGQINVYFNKDVNTTVSSGENALGNQDLIGKIVQRINNARRSVDVCLYSLSAVNQGNVVANALVAAKNRGVKVRVICEYDNSNTGGSSFPILASNGITVITDRYDAVWNGQGLMHNKFFVFDYRGGAPESVWVWSGSWNPTFQGTANDQQNAIEFQDVALAGAYTTEFNEMWGSTTDLPNAANSRFGARKMDLVPHNFVINGSSVKVYFSPSDQTTKQIRLTLAKAQTSISVAVLTFTRKDIADTIISRKNAGDKVRVVMDNNTDTGNQFSYLQSNGIDISLKGYTGGLLHHKYAIVDGTQTGGTQWVITGSHNWSNSAETSNDENTVIIQNNRIANLYLQEFKARYIEAGGTDPIVLGVQEMRGGIPSSFALFQNYPNPFNPTTSIEFQNPKLGFVTLKVFNLLGQEVATLLNEQKGPGTYRITWDAPGLASGVYFYKLVTSNTAEQGISFIQVKKMMLLR